MGIRQLRIMTHDVMNTVQDKRHKHGLKAMRVFTAGTVFAWSPAYTSTVKGKFSGKDQEVFHAAYVSMEGASGTIDEDLAKLIEDHSTPHEARTWKEMARAYDTNADGWLAAGVIEDLLRNGVVSPLELQAATHNAWHKED